MNSLRNGKHTSLHWVLLCYSLIINTNKGKGSSLHYSDDSSVLVKHADMTATCQLAQCVTWGTQNKSELQH